MDQDITDFRLGTVLVEPPALCSSHFFYLQHSLFVVWKWSESISHSVVSNSLWPHDLKSTRLLCPWILQARLLEWAAISFSRGSSWPRNQTQVSCISGRFFTVWATREALSLFIYGVVRMQDWKTITLAPSPVKGSEECVWGKGVGTQEPGGCVHLIPETSR